MTTGVCTCTQQSGLYYIMMTGVCTCTQTVGTMLCNDDWHLYLHTDSWGYRWWLAFVPEHSWDYTTWWWLAFVSAHKQSELYYAMTGVCICTQTVGTNLRDDWRLYLHTDSWDYNYVMTGVCTWTQTAGTLLCDDDWCFYLHTNSRVYYVMTGVLHLHTNSWDNMWWRLPFESAQKPLINWHSMWWRLPFESAQKPLINWHSMWWRLPFESAQKPLINWHSMWWRLPFNPAHKLLRQWLCGDVWYWNLHTNCWDNDYVVTYGIWICTQTVETMIMWCRMVFESAQTVETIIMWCRMVLESAHKLLRQWLCGDVWYLNLHTNCWDNYYVVPYGIGICTQTVEAVIMWWRMVFESAHKLLRQ